MLTIHLRVADAATKRPVPCRLRITDPAGTYYPPLGRLAGFACGVGEDVGGSVRVGKENFAHIDGSCEVPLPAGVPLRVRAFRGPEWEPLDRTLTLGPGQMAVRLEMTRWFDRHAEGLRSVDHRCHFLSPHAALLEAAAEDLDELHLLAHAHTYLAQDGNTYPMLSNLTAFSGQTPALEADGRAVMVNTFNTHPALGKLALLHSHRPIYPLAFGGSEGPDDWSLCDWADQCHRKKGTVVWCEAFRDGSGGEALAAAVLGKVDAIEVDPTPRTTPLLPWVYKLWNAGVLLPLAGASGKASNRVPAGAVRGYHNLPPPPPSLRGKGEPGEEPTPPPPSLTGKGEPGEEPTPPPPSLTGKGEPGEEPTPPPPSLRGKGEPDQTPPPSSQEGGGRGGVGFFSFITNGPLLRLRVEGTRAVASAESVFPFEKLEVVANGKVIASAPASANPRYSAAVQADLPASGWVASRVVGPPTTLFPDMPAFAHTSAVMVGELTPDPAAVSALRRSLEQTREWIETQGQFADPKRKAQHLARLAAADAKLGGTP